MRLLDRSKELRNKRQAVGFIEAEGLPAAIAAADAAVKAANVYLVSRENSRGGGYMTIKVVGEVGAVKAAVEAAKAVSDKVHGTHSVLVIPRPATGVHEGMIWNCNEYTTGIEPDGSVPPSSPKPPTPPVPPSPPAPEPAPEPEPEPVKAPEPEAVVSEPEPEIKSEPEAVASEPEPEIKSEPEAVSEPELEVKSEPEAVSEPEPEIKSEPEVVSEPEPEIKSEPEAVSETEPEVKAEPEFLRTSESYRAPEAMASEPEVKPEAADNAEEAKPDIPFRPEPVEDGTEEHSGHAESAGAESGDGVGTEIVSKPRRKSRRSKSK